MLYLLDVMLNYFTLQFFCCAVFSVVLLTIIMLLRKTIFQRSVFAKGMLWMLLVVTPFLGKLEFYYTSRIGQKLFGWWHKVCMDNLWVSRAYFAGIFLVITYLTMKRIRLMAVVRKMQKCKVGKQNVSLCKEKVTPFVTGIFHPCIVLPECIFEQITVQEIEAIVAHEKTHIRLLHPVIFLLWDIFRAVFWMNPLFAVCAKYMKSDMEDICDRVTMQRNGLQSYDYGKLLLHTIRLLQDRQKPDMDIPFAFAGEHEFERMKQRVLRIVDFKGYKKAAVGGLLLAGIVVLVGMFGVISVHSFANFDKNEEICLFDENVEEIKLKQSDRVCQVISYDEKYIYVDADELKELLIEEEKTGHGIWVYFGHYDKLPGYGVAGICRFVSLDDTEQGVIQIPYEENLSFLEKLFILV